MDYRDLGAMYEMSVKDLASLLREAKYNLLHLKMRKSYLEKPQMVDFKHNRRYIARILTVINAKKKRKQSG